jgi:hypothetical protein
MTEYVVLLMGDAERWWNLSEDERRVGYAAHDRFTDRLAEGGHQITGGAELHRVSEARTIAPGSTVATEGPWAETREQMGGFYVVATDDLDDLVQCCTLLAATGDAVEIRRCVEAEERAS